MNLLILNIYIYSISISIQFQYRLNNDNNKNYRIVEERGQKLECKQNGNLIIPIDPKLTGKYDYKKRV